jgi:hypothetical protein
LPKIVEDSNIRSKIRQKDSKKMSLLVITSWLQKSPSTSMAAGGSRAMRWEKEGDQ